MSLVRRLHLSRNLPWLFDFYWQARFLLAIVYERYLMRREAGANRSHASNEWDFTSAAEQERYRQVRAAIAGLFGSKRPAHVLELGCAQGLFTQSLAPLAGELAGIDISAAACALARQRCASFHNVRIHQADLFTVALPGPYSLILAMGVLQYVHGSGQHAQLARRLLAALETGGRLLINEVRLPERYEASWWAGALVEGGAQYVEFLGRYPGFRRVHHQVFADHVIAIFEKTTSAPDSSGTA